MSVMKVESARVIGFNVRELSYFAVAREWSAIGPLDTTSMSPFGLYVRVRSAQKFPRVAPAKKKNTEFCGNPWEKNRSASIPYSFMSMARCGSPAKKRNRSRPVSFFVVVLSCVM